MDFRDRFPRMQEQRLMGGIRLPAVRPCVVVNETVSGYVQYTHYDASGFRIRRSGNSWFTAEAWSRALAYAESHRLPVFRSGGRMSQAERVAA